MGLEGYIVDELCEVLGLVTPDDNMDESGIEMADGEDKNWICSSFIASLSLAHSSRKNFKYPCFAAGGDDDDDDEFLHRCG
jgi:hypothetical protein